MSRESALVSADWVEENLDTPNVVLVEVDEDTAAYDKNHIRNAVRIDWQDDLQDPVRRDFVSKAQFEELLGRKQEDGLVARALQSIPEEQRQIVLLSFVEDMPQSEIASKLSIPLGTVKSRMRLAYGHLRRILETGL